MLVAALVYQNPPDSFHKHQRENANIILKVADMNASRENCRHDRNKSLGYRKKGRRVCKWFIQEYDLRRRFLDLVSAGVLGEWWESCNRDQKESW